MDANKRTVLSHAAEGGHLEVVQYLAEKDADIADHKKLQEKR